MMVISIVALPCLRLTYHCSVPGVHEMRYKINTKLSTQSADHLGASQRRSLVSPG